jgi:iron complex outermembrane receptor protein
MSNLQRLSLAAAPLSLACAIQIILSGAVIADPAPSPGPSTSTDAVGLDEITVTARKRDEKLLDTPVAVVAFSAKDIEQQGLYALSDLAQATPGLSEDSTLSSSARNDRSFPNYIIRGMTPSTTLNPTTTVFIDGAPIISGQVEGLDDLERIEVLEGPQSAYFGRETFAGAINLVTRDPGNSFGAGLNVLAGNPNYYDTRVSLEGPIVSDYLTARATYRYYTRAGSYQNDAVADAAPGRLGDQSTQSESLELVARPIDGFKIKALYIYWADRDGPSAQDFIGPGQANCFGNSWFCGTVPNAAGRQPASNTFIDAPTAAFLTAANKPGVSLFNPPGKYGLARDAYHWSVGADYEIPSLFTISSLSSVDNQKWGEFQQLADEDTSQTKNPFLAFGGPFGQSFYSDPFLVEEKYQSFSQELRLTSDAQRAFRWLVGANYAWTRIDSTLAGSGSFNYFVPDAPTSTNSTAAFFGLAYDVLPSLTVNVEGRYQRDEQSTVLGIRGVFNNFTPRYIAQFKFTPDLMAYATYSEGVNPGTFNSNILSLSPADLANLESKYGAKVVVSPEKLKNYEIGLKGKFLENTLNLSGDVYYDTWTDQINVATLIYIEGGATKLTSADLNNGRVKVTGFEGKLDWLPIPHLEFDLSAAINDTNIQAGACVTCSLITGTSNVNGNELPNVSKYQGAAGLQYSDALGFLPDWGWFARLDDNYKSSNYASADNLVKTSNLNFVNVRAGLTRGMLRIEAFVDNLTNEGGATNLSLFYNVGNPFETFAKPDALVAGIPELRTYGIRVKYKFSL